MMVNEVMLAFHGAATGIAITDLDHRFIYANPAYCEMLGYSELELLGLRSSDVTHIDDRLEKMVDIDHVLSGKLRSVVIQKRYQGKDGRVVWGRLSVSAQRDDDGQIIGLIGVVEDITELEALQLRQLQAERSLERLLSNLPGMVYRCRNDAALTMQYLSHAAQALTGYPVDELIDNKVRSYASLVHPDDEALLRSAVDRSLRNGQAYQIEYRIRRADGSMRWVWEQGRPVIGNDGHCDYLEGYVVDITAQKAAEEELARARKLEALGQLTGGVAHDFNNLLTVILGNAELLQQSSAPDTQQALLAGMITNAAQRGAELTQALLAFARRQPLHPAPVAIDAMLADNRSLFERVLGETIKLQVHVAQALPPALVDRAQLESALLNLAINARDAMPAGGVLAIQVDSLVLDNTTASDGRVFSGCYVRIQVRDAGQGIAPDVLARVFEPFFTTKGRGKGTGLGLAMVHGFVLQSGGQISMESELGNGTTVTMLLPCADHEPVDPLPANLPRVGTPSRSGVILVVEDDALVRDYVCGVLEQQGYSVLRASQADQAYNMLLAGTHIDLLFTDIVMPGGFSGRVLAQKALLLRPDLPVLLTSGYPEHELEDDAAWESARLLPKPYRQAELLAHIERLLGTV